MSTKKILSLAVIAVFVVTLIAAPRSFAETNIDDAAPSVDNQPAVNQDEAEQDDASPADEQADETADEETDQSEKAAPGATDEVFDLFAAQDDGTVEVKFIAKNDHEGRILITNKLPHGVKVQIPDAFVGDPVVAQFGGGGGGLGGGGGGFGGGGGGGNQSVGGGGGGGFGGQGGGGGGVFSIPPERVTKVDVPLLCLDHGKADPSSSKPYKLRPVDSSIDRPEVVELLKAFGTGQLQHNAAQAAVWHLNNDLTWQQLASKLTGTRRSISRSPYFSRFELQAAYAYAGEAKRRGAEAEATQVESPGYDQ